jgi:tetraacyldisaccharide 4'-kinase
MKSTTFNLPIICVGNLSVGGTGKSPMIEHLAAFLQHKYNVAILSRGYKRRTKGYVLAGPATTALEIGDEPMQFHLRFPGMAVAVGEERVVAIPQLLHDRPDTNLLLLDDAFQHRAIQAGLNILLTDYNDLFTRDFFLPTGNLRDQRSSYKRADIIIVTKCPAALRLEEKDALIREIGPSSSQQVFFTTIGYGTPYHIIHRQERTLQPADEVLLVTGIANPRPLKQLLNSTVASYSMLAYADHHIFRIHELEEMRKKIASMHGQAYILTTEKDAVRLLKFSDHLADMPVYVMPVQHEFLFSEAVVFNNKVAAFAEGFRK